MIVADEIQNPGKVTESFNRSRRIGCEIWCRQFDQAPTFTVPIFRCTKPSKRRIGLRHQHVSNSQELQNAESG